MGQDLVLVCDKCKKIKFCSCRFYNIKKSEVQAFFINHKGHQIRAIGDDGGWDLRIEELMEEKGYTEEDTDADQGEGDKNGK